ncbi:GNAT family N-acetyltransferase [Glaciecola sp. SC05]|uniref:GNAT family N-acetyltransferase n=1 Tax=Glaciecola sp. SC05 TaxID=1987355 RepID=UPI0035295B11
MDIVENLTTQIHQTYSLDDVRQLFRDVEAPAGMRSIFTSEQWLVAWLKCADAMPALITFNNEGETIGFAFLGKQTAWYGDTYYLNQTGISEYDQMWIEHNDIICSETWLPQCRYSLLQALSHTENFHRLIISLCPSMQWDAEHTFLWSIDTAQVAYVDMSLIQNSSDGMAKLLSKNARSGINRSKNYIQKNHGDIAFDVVDNPIDTLQQKAAPLHVAQWRDTDSGSGFSNPHFVDFHKQLCGNNCENYRTEVLHFKAGEQDLGYLYMMLSHKTVFFYLSAINYNDDDNRYKPGLVMHKLAIEHYANLGYERYDFLAGYARYKETLSTHHYPLYTLHIANSALKHRILFGVNRAVKRFTQFKDSR